MPVCLKTLPPNGSYQGRIAGIGLIATIYTFCYNRPISIGWLAVSLLGEGAPDAVGTNAQAATATGGNDAESILERLRKRREQENP